MTSGAVGSTDVVGVLPTLEICVVPTLKFDDGFTLEGGVSLIRSGIHLFRLDVWCSVRTPVNEQNKLQWFIFQLH